MTPQPAPVKSPFMEEAKIIAIDMPTDFITLNGQRYYTVEQVSKHLRIGKGAIHDHCNKGLIDYVLQPGYLNGKKLLPEHSVQILLTTTPIHSRKAKVKNVAV